MPHHGCGIEGLLWPTRLHHFLLKASRGVPWLLIAVAHPALHGWDLVSPLGSVHLTEHSLTLPADSWGSQEVVAQTDQSVNTGFCYHANELSLRFFVCNLGVLIF